MIFVFLLVFGLLQCQANINREALRAKLLDAQNAMQFDQLEFDRLWNLGMSNGEFAVFFHKKR